MLAIISTFFFIVPFLSAPLLVLCLFIDKNFKHKKIYAALLAVVIALLLYYFIPDESKDLSRYYIIMGRLSKMPIDDLWGYLLTRNDPISWAFFYVVSKIGNYNLVMIFTTLISYGILFYILFNYQKKSQLSNLDFGMVLAFMLSTFYLVDDITGVRFCLGRLVFFLALYFDMYKDKKKWQAVALYLLSTLLHSSCLLFVFVRVFLKMMKNKFGVPAMLILALVSLSPNLLVMFADNLSAIPFLSSMGAKAVMYLEMTSGFYPMFILQVVIGVLLFIMLFYAKKNKISNEKYINFVLAIIFIGLLTMRTTSFSTRFIRAGIVFSIPVIMDYLKSIKTKRKVWVYLLIINICVVSIAAQISHLTFEVSYGTLFERGIFENLILLLLRV